MAGRRRPIRIHACRMVRRDLHHRGFSAPDCGSVLFATGDGGVTSIIEQITIIEQINGRWYDVPAIGHDHEGVSLD